MIRLLIALAAAASLSKSASAYDVGERVRLTMLGPAVVCPSYDAIFRLQSLSRHLGNRKAADRHLKQMTEVCLEVPAGTRGVIAGQPRKTHKIPVYPVRIEGSVYWVSVGEIE